MAEIKQVDEELIVRLRSTGLSMQKIADTTGYTFKTVRNVLEGRRLSSSSFVSRGMAPPAKLSNQPKRVKANDTQGLLPRGQ